MYCPRCGDSIEKDEVYCNKCGNYLGQQQQNNFLPNTQLRDKFKKIFFLVVFSTVTLALIFVFIIGKAQDKSFISSNNYENFDETSKPASPTKKNKYSTVIITDNTYHNVKIDKIGDAHKLISKDSISQKNNCPADIKIIENEIIEKYNILAVNLCEMDVELAREIGNVFRNIYVDYPSVKGYLTNLSLVNVPLSNSYIAAFMPAFKFATSDYSSTYPWVMKTQILLNTRYFLNSELLEASIIDGSSSGHFPPNATKYSPVAHELGHYLSFLAMMKNYQLNSILLVDGGNVNDFYDLYSDFSDGDYSLKILQEAYKDYKNDTKTALGFDKWRETISKYAVAKDNDGNYIYDETIAEAFHDVYLNKEKAENASKYIIRVLKEKLKD
ncbi:MAG: hypothetical protein RSB72_00635 [Bacilli bacterium]